MTIQQISIFMENKPGAFCNVAGTLSKNNINLRAMCVAETSDFGNLRIIVDDVEKTEKVLADGGYIYNETPVLAVEVADHPGSLMEILNTLNEANISLEYMYAFITRKTDSAYLVFRVDDTEITSEILTKAGIHMASTEELSNL